MLTRRYVDVDHVTINAFYSKEEPLQMPIPIEFRNGDDEEDTDAQKPRTPVEKSIFISVASRGRISEPARVKGADTHAHASKQAQGVRRESAARISRE